MTPVTQSPTFHISYSPILYFGTDEGDPGGGGTGGKRPTKPSKKTGAKTGAKPAKKTGGKRK
ncbi:MAG TPA: hypothetical protein VFF31_27985 [Blastocatellia bacterium]|nr:hypothetical protein [Blastocatellia bacterium]